eukprot:TRINITY_DN11133_c0_g1_i2.p1 TRINITY_DN11133_c0_g1~~TRINITY_DN11133_c0_g1_i2.p1  ORF type:complete len:588 (-),score=134.93 TRINITY_DN11133_c0_g1_i2:24-1787(-)
MSLWSVISAQQQQKALVLKPSSSNNSTSTTKDFQTVVAATTANNHTVSHHLRAIGLKSSSSWAIFFIPLLQKLIQCGIPIRSLSLARCKFQPDVLHPQLAPAIRNYFSSTTQHLRTLTCSGTDLGSNLDFLADMLDAVLEFSLLEELDLSDNDIGEEENHGSTNVIAQFISKNRSVRSLNLAQNPLRHEGVRKLSAALISNPCLSYLNLDQTNFSDARAISELLLSYSHCDDGCIKLETLIIGTDNLTLFQSSKIFFEVIAKNTTLQELDVSPGRISNAGLYALENVILNNAYLKKLKFTAPKLIAKGFIKLAAAIASCSLVELEIGTTPETRPTSIDSSPEVKHRDDSSVEESALVMELLRGISANSSLTSVGLIGIDLQSGKIEEELLIALSTNISIQTLKLEACELSNETSLASLSKFFTQDSCQLTSFSLVRCQVTMKVAARLAGILSSDKCSLTHLDLSSKMPLGCCRQICNAISCNSSLTSLAMSFEKMDKVSSWDLIDNICKSKNLRFCNLQTQALDMNGELEYLASKIEVNRLKFAEDRVLCLLMKFRQLVDPQMFEKHTLMMIMQFQWPEYDPEIIWL